MFLTALMPGGLDVYPCRFSPPMVKVGRGKRNPQTTLESNNIGCFGVKWARQKVLLYVIFTRWRPQWLWET